MANDTALRPVLVIDTTGRWCAAALKLADGRIIQRDEAMERGQAERLAPLVGELLDEAGMVPGELWRIGVATGPGSFAGTRAGTAFARGLALATGAQAIGISSLAAMALETDPEARAIVFTVHDARRGELVWQVFKGGKAAGEPVRSDVAAAREAFAATGSALLAGSGAKLLGPSAAWVDHAPLTALLALSAGASKDAPLPSPHYARPPDAALPGGIIP
ncbi:tRNA (adenosine(37)-N6)-threonylcarbamoyltransferase complex dimerization subunit type 1 TsaB [Glycocaulis albus]|jgi:tRNA threonylcarbamoyladenosine biosynthesis protein TsaB|uniref:tRNA (Adenosine(37)-N6)-threonylcarbamoyltransferase complex dimerization subunit type 1 TsaB n=1 Tax=Glycocaulis albus TaxID=1382801 RepID=A0ABQ1XJU3_9PROT|nr:tRNA (adenosine(37)-N6)-threonylcarbamoyltransferase complex dimerization subunit type 1 TsaB [Glycocaulis albus]MBV5259232.1 tRNA (adenosine(37)-N6)-threonylcarbamoyltransferase complex dimerization subunit type 1 TsaB [Synechococcus moorigangaii CMS01]GGG95595.1 tRNA (adenosine(37)-N6)-threonylcarbamoyltransferase complex dimerization subunit type 1 TsaB [Glycocaulis albus]